jgi:hypothetical protein
MAAIGWKPLSAADATARWPNAELSETVQNGVRAYYTHDDGEGFYRQRPIMLTLQRRDDGRTGVEIRVAPFALPPTLEADSEMAGLPRPKPTKTAKSSGGSDSVRRQMEVAVIAELPATLAFYRRELASRNWIEDTKGAVVTPDNVALNFSSAEQTATLTLGRKYDLTVVSLATQVKEAALAARAKAKKEADDKFMSDAAAMAKQVIAADEARRVAQAANLSDAPLRALADSATPVPLPENAENVEFDGADGRLGFDSSSSVKAIAAFYRSSLKSQGWKERPSVINQANMVVMDFSKGARRSRSPPCRWGPRSRSAPTVPAWSWRAPKWPPRLTDRALQPPMNRAPRLPMRFSKPRPIRRCRCRANAPCARSEPERCLAATPRSAGSSRPAFPPH